MKIIKFSAPWCSACKALDPIFEDFKTKYDIEELDVDKHAELASKTYKIRKIPVVLVLDGEGQEVERVTGVKTKEEFSDIFNKYFNL